MHLPTLARLAIATLLLSQSLFASAAPVYRCDVNGSTTFQSTPCPAGVSQKSSHTAASKSANRAAPAQNGSSGFRCDGRKLCSQMTSCAEATYFLKNCPGVKMDGDYGHDRPGDGVPCEAQWCGK